MAIDLGNEPPLSVDGGTGGVIDRRRISVQWFSGTILTGVCGAALMGGAVFASLDGETNFATVPERDREHAARRHRRDRRQARRNRKSRPPAAGQRIHRLRARCMRDHHAPTRVGDREVVRVRPFVRVSANLSLTPHGIRRQRAAVQCAEAAGAGRRRRRAEPTISRGAEPDAEVSYVTRDLAADACRGSRSPAALPIDESSPACATPPIGPAALAEPLPGGEPAVGGGAPLAYAAEGTPDPYAGFETRIVPENITLLPKTGAQVTGGNAWNERSITVKKGDNIATILKEIGATPDEINAIAAALGPRGRANGLKEGQKLRILVATIADGSRLQPIRVIVHGRQRDRCGRRAVRHGPNTSRSTSPA